MDTEQTAREFLEAVRDFNKAMDGPSGDAETQAACNMRDSALAGFRELGARDIQVAKLLQDFDSEEDDQ